MSSEITINFCETIGGIRVSPQAANFQGDFTNVAGSGQNGSTATIRYIVPFAEHIAVLSALLEAYVTPNYIVGMQHPNYGGMFCYDVKVSTLASESDPIAFAVLDASYKPLPFNPSSPAVIYEDQITVNGEVQPIMQESMTFADGTQLPRDEGYLIQYLTYKRTLKNVSTVNLSAVTNCQNKVNSGAMTLHVGTANAVSIPAEYVLYVGIDDIKIQYTMSGSQRFDVTHCFLISPINLNYAYNPNSLAANVTDRFERVTPNKYEQADMSSLGI